MVFHSKYLLNVSFIVCTVYAGHMLICVCIMLTILWYEIHGMKLNFYMHTHLTPYYLHR